MCPQQKTNPDKSKHGCTYYLSLPDLITDRSDEYSIQESNSSTHRWGNTEKDGTAPENSEVLNQPSHFMKFEKTQLFSLY